MPFYEFYCPDCHTIYNFYSRRINTGKIPACPAGGCNRERLERQVSLFAISKGRGEDEDGDMLDNLDESTLEQAMMSMAGEMEHIDENDPREAAKMMRRLFDATGLQLSGGMEEAISRMEAGEDPEQVEAEMGDRIEEEEPFAVKPKKLLSDLRRKYLPPRVDETLYDL